LGAILPSAGPRPGPLHADSPQPAWIGPARRTGEIAPDRAAVEVPDIKKEAPAVFRRSGRTTWLIRPDVRRQNPGRRCRRSRVEAVNALAQFGQGAYEDGPGRLSPRVFWWRAATLTSITVFDQESRTMSLSPPDELMTIMRRLAGTTG